ncbi:hypothetical protein BFJ67_g15206 [Fusarium oxysporum f. sp. cepae]|nr:hypothetical protein BFJ67_g15206 [Fusarium oxysporum f. sp. cepae]
MALLPTGLPIAPLLMASLRQRLSTATPIKGLITLVKTDPSTIGPAQPQEAYFDRRRP